MTVLVAILGVGTKGTLSVQGKGLDKIGEIKEEIVELNIKLTAIVAEQGYQKEINKDQKVFNKELLDRVRELEKERKWKK